MHITSTYEFWPEIVAPKTRDELILSFTPERMQELLENHRGLLRKAGVEFDEAMSIAYEVVCKAAQFYDFRRVDVKFTTYASAAVVNKLRDMKRAARVERRALGGCRSFELLMEQQYRALENCYEDEAEDEIRLKGDYEEPEDIAIEDIMTSALREEIRRRLGETDWAILNMRAEGASQEEIASAIGCTQPCVCMRLKKLREQMADFRVKIA